MRVIIHAHVTFAHRFQERALRFRSSTVDLIHQHDVGENRSAAEFEGVARLAENGHSQYVGRQQIAGELDPAKCAVKTPGQRVGESGLPDARHIFNQQMTVGQEADQCESNRLRFAQHDSFDCLLQLANFEFHFDSFRHRLVIDNLGKVHEKF